MKKRISAVLLALIMVVTGLYVTQPKANEAWAADTNQVSEKITPDTANTDMLAIKMQASKEYTIGDKTVIDLRIVTSVNGLGYSCVGLKVWYGEHITIDEDGNVTLRNQPTATYNTESVIKRIDASKYKYSPKVVDTSSEYFVTATIKGINVNNFDKNFYIQAYCKPLEGAEDTSTVYGEGKLFNIADATKDVNIAVPQGELTGKEINNVTVNGEPATATLAGYHNGKAHLYVNVDGGKTSLPSASKIVVGGAESESYAIYRNLESAYTGNNADTSWYTVYAEEGETEFVIATDADLYGFANANTNFAGNTVYMVADIDANDDKGTATASGFTRSDGKTPYVWAPIGRNFTNATYNFAGTFDGEQHTISGLYFSYTGSYTGGLALFGTTGLCTIRDFNLANTYFKLDNIANNVNLAGIAGVSDGIFDSIKVEEDVYIVHGPGSKEDYAGGIVATMSGKTENGSKISNCQFSGTIIANDYVGGILGYAVDDAKASVAATVHKKPIEIEHCLNNGKIVLNATGNTIGGICGTVVYGQVKITDSVNVAQIDLNGYSVNNLTTGSFIGWIRNNYLDLAVTTDGTENTYTAIIENSYGVSGGNWKSLGYKNSKGHTKLDGIAYAGSGALNNTKVNLSVANLTGAAGYVNTNLDYSVEGIRSGYWTATTTTPALTSFVDQDKVISVREITSPRTAWYVAGTYENTEEYTLYTKADMYGFASLSNVDFAGKTVKLGADITMNEGTVTEWQTASFEGLQQWTAKNFAGIFDGDDYTIQGVCLTSSTGNVGLFATVTGTVQNLRLLNSYFACTDTTGTGFDKYQFVAPMGSIAGTLAGTLDTVYSDAIVDHTDGAHAGGLVGMITSTTTTNKIINSCFAGSVIGHVGVGGILGTLKDAQVTISHCMNTGLITGGEASGGLCGYVYNDKGATVLAELTLEDCLNVGSHVKGTFQGYNFYGSIVGAVRNRAGNGLVSVKINDTYGIGYAADGTVLWNKIASKSNASLLECDGKTSNYAIGYHLMTLQALISKTSLNLSFQVEGAGNSQNYWVARDGKIPMLESFEDLLTNVTY